MRTWILWAAGSLAFGGMLQRASAQTTLFADAFNEPNGTVVNGKAADIGGPWLETSGTNLTIQNSSINTSGFARIVYAPFTRPLAAGETATLTFNSSNVNLFRDNGAYAGVSLYTEYAGSSNVGNERIFIGDRSLSAAGWGAEQTGGDVIQSTNTDLPATVVLNYVYDTGAVTFSVNGTVVGTDTFTPDMPLNAVRIANGLGGDIQVDDILVVATTVPEPATLGFAAFAGALLIRSGSRRALRKSAK